MTFYSKSVVPLAALLTLALAPDAQAQASYTFDVNDPKWADSDNSTDWSIKKKYCREGNFFKMGFNRAYHQRKREKGLEKITKKCKKVDVVVNEQDYFAGYDKGLKSRCSFSTGLREGRNYSKEPSEFCDYPGLLPYYVKGLKMGLEQAPVVYEYEKRDAKISEVKSQIEQASNAISSGAELSIDYKTYDTTAEKKDYRNARMKYLNRLELEQYDFEKSHPHVFDDMEALIDQHGDPNWPSHWRD